jgi:hypothetical membrane protein
MKNRRFTISLACLLIILSVVQFVIIWSVAMARYPGGNEWDHSAEGYSFWRNTFSDLGKTVTCAGRANPNLGGVFNLSLTAVMLGLAPLWLVLPRLFPTRRLLGRIVRVLGMLSILGMFGVGLVPGDHSTLHAAFIGMAAVPGLAAAITALAAMFLCPRCPKAYVWFTLAFLATALVHFGQYVNHFWLGGPWTPAAPAAQKVAVLFGLAWMLVTAGAVRQFHPVAKDEPGA